MSDTERLRGFIRALGWRDGEWCRDISGADLCELMEDYGLIEMVTRDEACCENCACALVFGANEFPLQCFRWTEVMG